MATPARRSTAHAPIQGPRQSRASRRRGGTSFFPSRRSALPPADAWEASIPGVAPWQAADAPRSQLHVSFPCYSTDETDGENNSAASSQSKTGSSSASSSSAPRRRRSSSTSGGLVRRNPVLQAKGTPPAALVAMLNSNSDEGDVDVLVSDGLADRNAARSPSYRQSAPVGSNISLHEHVSNRPSSVPPFSKLDSDDDTTVETASSPTSSDMHPSEAGGAGVDYGPVVTSSSFAERLQAFSQGWLASTRYFFPPSLILVSTFPFSITVLLWEMSIVLYEVTIHNVVNTLVRIFRLPRGE